MWPVWQWQSQILSSPSGFRVDPSYLSVNLSPEVFRSLRHDRRHESKVPPPRGSGSVLSRGALAQQGPAKGWRMCPAGNNVPNGRSEERRVGKEWRFGGGADQSEK